MTRRERVELPGGRRAGVHLPMGMGLVRVVERASEIGASALQIFSDNPTAWRRRAEAPPEAAAFRERLKELDIWPVAIHAAYLVNLAGPDDDLFGRSVEMIRHELEHAPELDARFVNIHAGSHRGAGLEAGIGRLVDGLERATDGAFSSPDAPLLVLENSSGGGFTIGSTIQELAWVLESAAARGLDGHLAICLDVAHLWGAGYDVSRPEAIDRLLEEVDRTMGLDRLVMVHLNDSRSALGARHDHHAHLGEGQIGRAGLAHFLCHPALSHVAFYLETPEMEKGYDAVNVSRLGDLAADRPLTPGLRAAQDSDPTASATLGPRSGSDPGAKRRAEREPGERPA